MIKKWKELMNMTKNDKKIICCHSCRSLFVFIFKGFSIFVKVVSLAGQERGEKHLII